MQMRWSDNTKLYLNRVFEQMQQAQIVRIKIEAVSLDSTIVKIHPDAKKDTDDWKVTRRGELPRFIWPIAEELIRLNTCSSASGGRFTNGRSEAVDPGFGHLEQEVNKHADV